MADKLTPAKLARLLHESYLEGYGPPLPSGWDHSQSWAALSSVQRRMLVATARVLLKRLTITVKETARG